MNIYNLADKEDIPEYYKNITGPVCKVCHAPLEVNENNTKVRCSSPVCPYKLASTLDKRKDFMGIKGYGISFFLSYVVSNKHTSFAQGIYDAPAVLQDATLDCLVNIHTISQAIDFLKIPRFGEEAKALFANYSCFTDFFMEYIDKCSTADYIYKLTGKPEISANLAKIIEDNIQDFYLFDSIFDFHSKKDEKPIEYTEIPICITNEINNIETFTLVRELGFSGRISKSVFVSAMNKMFAKKNIVFNLKQSYSQAVKFVICDTPTNTAKERDGRRDGKLVTSIEFIAIMLKLVGERDGQR